MKKFATLLLLIVTLTALSSFKQNWYYCHALGDLIPCTHPQHFYGDQGICTHSYYDGFGNIRFLHSFDLYPCVHPQHYLGDNVHCTHICY